MKKVLFWQFCSIFFIVFDHVNACVSMRLLVKIHNSGCSQQTLQQPDHGRGNFTLFCVCASYKKGQSTRTVHIYKKILRHIAWLWHQQRKTAKIGNNWVCLWFFAQALFFWSKRSLLLLHIATLSLQRK